MTTYNKKCQGCGSELNSDPNKLGYVPKFDAQKTKLCQRCFRMKNYNENNEAKLVLDKNIKPLDKINFVNKKVYLVIDLLDIFGTLLDIDPKADLTILVNKMDLLPSSYNYQKIISNIASNVQQQLNRKIKIHFVSANSLSSIKQLNSLIRKDFKKYKKVYFIGASNVGKSSIIKKLLEVNNISSNLLINNSLNTTIALNEIKIDHNYLIDTPGQNAQHNTLMYLEPSDLNKIAHSKKLKQKIYQLKYDKCLHIENLLSMNLHVSEQGSVVFYSDISWNITTANYKKELNLLKENSFISYQQDQIDSLTEYEFVFNETSNTLLVQGIGIFVFKNVAKVKILINKNIAINKLFNNLF